MPDNLENLHAELAQRTICYARIVILRADIPFGGTPKLRVAEACSEDAGLRKGLLRSYGIESRKTNINLLGSASFISSMRARSLQRFACNAKILHDNRIEDKTVTPKDQSRLDWGDNPNAFLQISQFLRYAASINKEQALLDETISIEQTASEANSRWIRANRDRLRKTRPLVSRPRS